MVEQMTLEQAIKRSTEQYLELQRRAKTFESIPEEERSINVSGEKIILDVGSEAPVLTGWGVVSVRVYDARRNEYGAVEFGVGNETLPVLSYASKEAFYHEWAD